MENISPKMAAAFGVGFIGFIFAAYSYNQQHKDEFIHYSNEHLNTPEENSDNDSLDKTENDSLDKTKNDSLDKTKNDSLDKTENDKNITEKVTSFLEDIKKKPPNWGKFWKGEFEDMRNKND